MPTEPQVHERKAYSKPRKKLAKRVRAWESNKYKDSRKKPGSLKK